MAPEAPPATSSGGGFAQYVPLVGQIVGGVFGSTDPREEAAIIRAKIENKKQLRRQFPFMALIYDSEIRKLQERLVVVEKQAEEAQSSVNSTQTAKTLLLAGGGVMLISGLVITVGLAGVAYRIWKPAVRA
jgi:hypothetical protein